MPGRWCARVLATQACLTLCSPWTASLQAPLSMGFSGQEHWSGLPCPPPGDLPNPGVKPQSLALQTDSLLSESAGRWRDPNLTLGDGGSCGFPSRSQLIRLHSLCWCHFTTGELSLLCPSVISFHLAFCMRYYCLRIQPKVPKGTFKYL